MTTRLMSLMLAVVIVCGSGCAKPDWIQQTLVTADVTGVWVGPIGTGSMTVEVRLELEQQGPQIKGHLQQTGARAAHFPSFAGPLDGTLRGDVFSFTMANGSGNAELTVGGDEMKGYVSLRGRHPIFLRRIG